MPHYRAARYARSPRSWVHTLSTLFRTSPPAQSCIPLALRPRALSHSHRAHAYPAHAYPARHAACGALPAFCAGMYPYQSGARRGGKGRRATIRGGEDGRIPARRTVARDLRECQERLWTCIAAYRRWRSMWVAMARVIKMVDSARARSRNAEAHYAMVDGMDGQRQRRCAYTDIAPRSPPSPRSFSLSSSLHPRRLSRFHGHRCRHLRLRSSPP
ncbi:hypothetical protein DFH06DRAFT_601763 [Mycena polygramma]|nr:hypothetical protein DFH06DRAFT_601763 [Mycena polygramma]